MAFRPTRASLSPTLRGTTTSASLTRSVTGEICRVAFDGKDIEMMTLGPWHESEKSLLEAFIAIVAGELKIERQPLGSTTWKRKKLKRAIESDLCYYFDPAKLAAYAAALRSNNVDVYPNPDLAVEIDISKPKIDRPGIYAALEVPEFWRSRKRVGVDRATRPGWKVRPGAPESLPSRPVRGRHAVGLQRGLGRHGAVGGAVARVGA